MNKLSACLFLCCVSLSALADGNQVSAKRVQTLYQAHCQACHATGKDSAPKTGDIGDWGERLMAGIESLVEVTQKGTKVMPPKGGCNECSDAELQAIIEMMSTDANGG